MRRAVVALALAVVLALVTGDAPTLHHGESRAHIVAAYDSLPLRFEPNEGQTDTRARYVARGPSYTFFVMPTEMILSLGRRSFEASVVRVSLAGARTDARVDGLEELPGKTNHFRGSDRRRWRTSVAGYAKVRCRDVYPGIDVVYYGNQRQLEYDFVVAPGEDPRRIRLRFEGARSLRLDDEGNLVVAVEGGDELVHHAPRVHQEADSRRDAVRGGWVLRDENEAGFELAAYDTARTLIIDPQLSYSTYLGGNGDDQPYAIAVDGTGSVYLTGHTSSTDFPTQNPYEMDQPDFDVFVTKLAPGGNSLVYSTYLGGNGDDQGYGIEVDSSGSAYVIGHTSSTDFPTQSPYQTDQPGYDVFVTRLTPEGTGLVYSTYLGGSDADVGHALAVDSSGNAYVTGGTLSTDFPTMNPYQADQTGSDAFVTKLSPSGNGLVYSTYLGGNGDDLGYGIEVDSSGSAYVIGYTSSTDFPTQNPYQTDQPSYDVFVTRLTPAGTGLVYSTYLGGNDLDYGYDIAVDDSGAYVTGQTRSTNFPTQGPYQGDQPDWDAFVTKLAPSGDSLVYSTYLGGSAIEQGLGIAVDGSGIAYATGTTASTDFPTQDPYQVHQPLTDVFVTKLSSTGNGLLYSTYLGGNGGDTGYAIAVDSSGSAYLIGQTLSTDFPTRNPYQMDQPGVDGFVAKLSHATDFFTLPPCRAVDTREAAGPFGGPALAAGADRDFALIGRCAIPPTARAVSVNLAVTGPGAAGNLRLYPSGTPLPVVSSINYVAGQTRANNAIVTLSSSGTLRVRCSQGSGTAHFILDVNGYFE